MNTIARVVGRRRIVEFRTDAVHLNRFADRKFAMSVVVSVTITATSAMVLFVFSDLLGHSAWKVGLTWAPLCLPYRYALYLLLGVVE